MVAFYSQEDQDIYEKNKFMPQSKYLLNAPTFNTPTVEEKKITETFGIPYTNAFTGSGSGEGGPGGGWFGNLDTSNTKMFDKNVFSTDMVSGPPSLHQKMTGSFKPQQVQGYYNPTLGQYQTLEGKNINHLGINVKPIFASILESMGVGAKKNKLFDHKIGAIEGTFTHGAKSGMDKIKEGWEEEKDKWAGITGIKKAKTFFKNKKEQKLQDEILAHNDAAAAQVQAIQDRAAGSHSSQVQLDPGGGGTWHKQTAAKERQGQKVAGPGGGDGAYFNQGGRVGYFFGGRTGFAEGGEWSPGVGRDESGYQSDHGSYTGGDNNTTAPTTTFFNNPEIIKEETMFGEVPAGLGFNNDLGKYKAVMDLRNSIKNQNVEGEIEYNNTIGDFDFGGKYDTQDGATYGASYNKNGLGVNYNNIDGTSASYNKGPFSISTDGDNTTAGVKWTFKNGGLAGIL